LRNTIFDANISVWGPSCPYSSTQYHSALKN
jgi:hypothetical protein